MRSRLVLLIFISFVITIILATAAAAVAAAITASRDDEWMLLKDLRDEHVMKIAEFAVKRHDKEEMDHLALDEVVKGEYKKVRRHKTKYKLVLAAMDEKKKKQQNTKVEEDNEDIKHYKAVVVEKSKDDEQRLRLISFKPVQ